MEVPAFTGTVVARTVAARAFGTGALSRQDLVYLGGPQTGPGYDYHQFIGPAGTSQRFEWQHDASLIPIPLGSVGSMRALTKVALYETTVLIDPVTGPSTAYASLGAGAEFFAGLLRIDIARGLRAPYGRWMFGIDAGRAYWSIL